LNNLFEMSANSEETATTIKRFMSEFTGCMEFTGKKVADLLEGSYTHFQPGPDTNFRESPTKIFTFKNYNINFMVNADQISTNTMAMKLMLPHDICCLRRLPTKLLGRSVPINWRAMKYFPIFPIPSLNKDFGIKECEFRFVQNLKNPEKNEFLVDTKIYNSTLTHALRISFLIKSNEILEKSCGFMINPASFPHNYHMTDLLEDMEAHEWLNEDKSDWVRKLDCSLQDWANSLMVESKKVSFHVVWDFLMDIDHMQHRLKLTDDKFWRDLGHESLYIDHLKMYCDLNRLFIGLLFKQIDAVWDRNLELTNDIAVLLEKLIKR
jgi:hypothetical protein